jgi:hypothetical protein
MDCTTAIRLLPAVREHETNKELVRQTIREQELLPRRLGSRRILDAPERPVGREPLTHDAPERRV